MSRVVNVLTSGTPWAITADMLQTITQIANRKNNLEAVLKERGKPLENTRSVEMRDSVAVIHVTGPLFPRANLFNEISGAQSVQMLAIDLAEAEKNPDVRSVVLVLDTPGGHVTMINEFANIIRAFGKPIVGYVQGSAASGGYWLAAATDKIVVDATAIVGSIGVVAGYRADDKSVIEIVSSNAPDKRPDLDTKEGLQVIQSLLNDTEDVFINAVMNFRGMTREQVIGLRGGVVIGAKAIESGFADELGSLESVISQLQEENPMDLSTLKADHTAVYDAAVAVGVQQASADNDSALTAASGEAITAERSRISAILGSEEATGRGKMASHIALETAMTADDAKKMLASAPVQTKVDGFTQMDTQLSADNPDVSADADTDDLSGMDAELAAFNKVGEIN